MVTLELFPQFQENEIKCSFTAILKSTTGKMVFASKYPSEIRFVSASLVICETCEDMQTFQLPM